MNLAIFEESITFCFMFFLTDYISVGHIIHGILLGKHLY